MKDELSAIADAAFDQLIEQHGFKRSATEKAAFGKLVVYQNATSGIRVVIEDRDQSVFVQLFRIRNGHIPTDWGIGERAADPLNGFDANDLLELRAPGSRITGSDTVSRTSEKLREILTEYADALCEYAGDFLKGDFRVFEQLGMIVARRAKESGLPDERNVYLHALAKDWPSSE